MAELLLFQLYGPMASWGEPAVGEYRPSATHPGKSQITGLLAAALGIRRNQTDALTKLTEGYGVAVRIDRHGTLLRDYHTTQVPPDRKKQRFVTRAQELKNDTLNTILSQRDYRADAAWTCAVWAYSEAPHTLNTLKNALIRPRFTLYLGRKSCPPALPLAPRIIQADTLIEAFAHYPNDPRLSFSETDSNNLRHYYWEEPLAQGMSHGFTPEQLRWITPRWDVPGDRLRWQFSVRDEHHAVA